MTGPAVDVRDVFRIHSSPEGAAAALQGLSLAVPEGEILVVLGPSGSGKTTLLRILAGLDSPSAGSVRVFGEEIGRLAPHALGAYRTTTVGYADQHYSRALEPELTARELVALQPGLRGVPAAERLRRADELLERVGLHAKRRSRPDELSGGEQQRVAACAAIAHGPRLFLADEPTGELDAANADLVYAAIADLVRVNRCTAVIVSHDPESATIADRVVRIRDGRVSEESSRKTGVEGSIVVGRGGWLRLPEEFLRRAGIRSRATARLDDDSIVVQAAEAGLVPIEPDAVQEREAEAGPREIVAEVRRLTRAYGTGAAATVALQELTASFGSGRLCAVTGPSGSGKTTLLHLLAGLDVPTDGDVAVLGTELAGLDRDARATFRREWIGLVGQQPGLIPFLTARENVELGLSLRGLDDRAAALRAHETLAAVGLDERADQRVARLSTGERGRVAIARALAPRPALLLADEPTSRLDQANAIAVAGLLARLARESGTTIVCATHDPVVIEHADEELKLQAPEAQPVAAATPAGV